MKRFKNILYCVKPDNEQHPALDRVARLTRENSARLTVVSVIEHTPGWMQKVLPGQATRWFESYIESIDTKLRQLVDHLSDQTPDLKVKTMTGHPWLEIIKLVLKNDHDLVITEARQPAAPAATLSVSGDNMRLLRKCPAPVWILRPSVSKYRRVAAALDLEPENPEKEVINEHIMELAISLAESEQSEVHVIRAWSVYGGSVLQHHMHEDEYEELRQRTLTTVTETVDQFLGRFADAGVPIHKHIVEGDADAVIAGVAEREEEDIVVMGTLARRGVSGVLLGNTAERILYRLRCSVLAVKPDDFVSPVKADV